MNFKTLRKHLPQEKEDGSGLKQDYFVRENCQQMIQDLQILIGSGWRRWQNKKTGYLFVY